MAQIYPAAVFCRWVRTRDEIREVILQEGFNQQIGAFTQFIGGSELDATALTIPLLGLLPATDERVKSTIAQIKEKLSANGLVYRYLTDDGLPGREATFGICSFWFVDNLALAGRIDEARTLVERLTHYAEKLHLFSEQIEPETGQSLGNLPARLYTSGAYSIGISHCEGRGDGRREPLS